MDNLVTQDLVNRKLLYLNLIAPSTAYKLMGLGYDGLIPVPQRASLHAVLQTSIGVCIHSADHWCMSIWSVKRRVPIPVCEPLPGWPGSGSCWKHDHQLDRPICP